MKMKEYSARCNLVVSFTSRILGTMHKELFAHTCITLKLKKYSQQSLFALTGQFPTKWLAGMLNPHALFRKFTPKYKHLVSMQFSFCKPLSHTVFLLGFIGFKYCLCIFYVLNQLLLFKVTRLSTTRKLIVTQRHLQQQGKLPLVLLPAICISFLFYVDFQWSEIRCLCNFLTFQLRHQ